MNTTTPEQIAKLPRWAQEHIKDLERQREVAVRALDEYVDAQTESPFYTLDNECTGERQGPTFRKRYIQAHSIEVEWRGVVLSVDANDYGQVGGGIRLKWEAGGKHASKDAAFIPSSYQSARIVSKEDMR